MGGTIIKLKKPIKSNITCKKCRFYYKGICNVISKMSGKPHYISSILAAKKCVHYAPMSIPQTNKNTTKKQRPAKQPQNNNAQLELQIGAHCNIYKTCRVCNELKYFLEFQSKGSFSQRKNYCRECKITGKVPGKSGKTSLVDPENQ